VHWDYMPAFQESFPDVELTRSLFVIDGDRITCSGGVAGLDMMMALITRDHGHALAAAVSDWFLHSHVREGGGPQRMDLRFRLGVGDEKLLAALKAMEANIESPLSRAELAKLAGISCGSWSVHSAGRWTTACTSITSRCASGDRGNCCARPRSPSSRSPWLAGLARRASSRGHFAARTPCRRARP
jgi:hypothetical protein